MLQLFLSVFIFISPAPAKAGSTDTVSVPAVSSPQQPGAIELLGYTGAQAPAKLKTGAEVEFKKPKKSRPPKNKKAEAPVAPPEKTKLIPVHFKEEPSHKSPYTCRWALGKAIEMLTGPKQKQAPAPQPIQLQPAPKPRD